MSIFLRQDRLSQAHGLVYQNDDELFEQRDAQEDRHAAVDRAEFAAVGEDLEANVEYTDEQKGLGEGNGDQETRLIRRGVGCRETNEYCRKDDAGIADQKENGRRYGDRRLSVDAHFDVMCT